MPPLPWIQRQPVDITRDYVAMLSCRPIRRYRSIPGLLRDTLAIRRQLADAPGLVGYTLDAELHRKTFWTFSVWTDEDNLRSFAGSEPHRRIVERLRPHLGASIARTAPITGTQLPVAWRKLRQLVNNARQKETSS